MATGAVKNTRDIKQITFELNKRSVLFWRRALLFRYYVELGKKSNIHVEWVDSDKKQNPLLLNDEESTFSFEPSRRSSPTVIYLKQL